MKKVLLLLLLAVVPFPMYAASYSSSRSFSSGSSFRSSPVSRPSYTAPRVSTPSAPKVSAPKVIPAKSISPNQTMTNIKSQPYAGGTNVYQTNYNPFSSNFIFYFWLFGGFNNHKPTPVATTTATTTIHR